MTASLALSSAVAAKSSTPLRFAQDDAGWDDAVSNSPTNQNLNLSLNIRARRAMKVFDPLFSNSGR